MLKDLPCKWYSQVRAVLLQHQYTDAMHRCGRYNRALRSHSWRPAKTMPVGEIPSTVIGAAPATDLVRNSTTRIEVCACTQSCEVDARCWPQPLSATTRPPKPDAHQTECAAAATAPCFFAADRRGTPRGCAKPLSAHCSSFNPVHC
jgi:hypothetical protein